MVLPTSVTRCSGPSTRRQLLHQIERGVDGNGQQRHLARPRSLNGIGSEGIDRAHLQRHLPLLGAAIPASDGALKPAARSARPTDVPSKPVPKMEMRSIMRSLAAPSSYSVLPTRLRNHTQLAHQLFKLIEVERLRGVGHGLVGVGVDLDEQRIGARGHGALAIAGTMSRRPVPCEGSATTGRCVSFFSTGMAAMSIVLRVDVS